MLKTLNGRTVQEYHDALVQHLMRFGLSAVNNRSEVFRTLKRFVKYYDSDKQCDNYLLKKYGLNMDDPTRRFNLYIQLNKNTGKVLNVSMPDFNGTMRRFPPYPGFNWSGVIWPANPHNTGAEGIKRLINRQWNRQTLESGWTQ